MMDFSNYGSEFRRATREYNLEIARRAADLIRNYGYTPWEALRAAQDGLRRQRGIEQMSRSRKPT